MSLRSRLGSWIAGQRASSEPIAFHPSTQFFGQGLGIQPNHATLLRESLGIADMATRAISNRISTLNPLVKVSRRVAVGTIEDEILDDHALKKLLDRPHPNLSRAQLFRLTAQYIISVGEAYWLKVGSGLGVPIELHPIPPAQIWPQLSRGVVQGYILRDGDGGERLLPADTVLRFYFPDPESPWHSEGYLGPSGITADSLKFSTQHLRSHYENDATPKAWIKTTSDATEFSDDEKSRFFAVWRKRYHNRVGTEQGLPGILPLGFELIQFAAQSGADVTPLLELWRDEMLMTFGVPRSVLGQVVSGDRSSAETNEWVFDRYSVAPIANLLSDGITLQLAPDFDRSIFCEFEPFVQEDKRFTLEKQTADLRDKVRSINQVRHDDGLDPVEWGELPVGQLGQVPYDATLGFELDVDDEGALEDEEDRVRSKGRAAFFHPRAEWLRQVRREKKFVPAFLRAIQRIVREQRDSVIARLRAAEDRKRSVPSVDALFSPDDWVDIFKLRVDPIREAAFREILAETLAGLGIDAFTFTDEMRRVLRHQGALLVRQANATTKRRIAEQLEVAVVKGEGVESVAKRIEQVFKIRRRESRTIARTEVLKASQKAQVTGFEESGVVERKRWHTSLDEAVRDTHVTADGQTVDLRDVFILGNGEPAEAPGLGAGGASLSAGNSINCRCFVVPVLEGD